MKSESGQDMKKPFEIEIDEGSRVPKYQQVVDKIVSLIANGSISKGEKLPSINELSEQLYLSRDTVEKAYNMLRREGLIKAIPGKGNFVNTKKVLHQGGKILYLVNKVSAYKLEVFKTFQEALSVDFDIELKPFFYDPQLFIDQLGQSFDQYDYIVMVPIFNDGKAGYHMLSKEILQCIEQIPKEKLIVLEKYRPQITGKYTCIYQDFKNDIITALTGAIELIKKYDRINLIFPDGSFYQYPTEIRQGFLKFCVDNRLEFNVFDDKQLDKFFGRKQAYIVISENDFLELMKRVKTSNMKLGSDIGLISYNDTPLKELFNVSVLSTDFKMMGEYAARSVSEKKRMKIKNDFQFIQRKSL